METILNGRYRLGRELGRGGFGAVYEAEVVGPPGGRVALKILKGGIDDERQRERFQREALVLLKLVHPSIVTIREFSRVGDLVCYAMDYVDGPTLKKVIEKEGALPVPRALARTREVLEALALAHEIGVIHRDMKPENIILERAGEPDARAKILDFGIAKLLSDTAANLTQGGAIGTPAYMSPEQAGGKKGAVDARSDLYSVGCVLYEMLTGRPPFVSDSVIGYVTQHSLEPVPPFSETTPGRDFPAGLETIVRRALEKRPDDRFQSAEDMIAAIDDLGIVKRRGSGKVSAVRPTGSGRLSVSAAAAAAALIDWERPLEEQAVDQYLRSIHALSHKRQPSWVSAESTAQSSGPGRAGGPLPRPPSGR